MAHGRDRDDKYHGKGVYRAANGDVFMGLYKNGAMKEGELIYANGDRYKGLFKVVPIASPPLPKHPHPRGPPRPVLTHREALCCCCALQ
jgi:hypothetical protein